jgi:hypothetical protein
VLRGDRCSGPRPADNVRDGPDHLRGRIPETYVSPATSPLPGHSQRHGAAFTAGAASVMISSRVGSSRLPVGQVRSGQSMQRGAAAGCSRAAATCEVAITLLAAVRSGRGRAGSCCARQTPEGRTVRSGRMTEGFPDGRARVGLRARRRYVPGADPAGGRGPAPVARATPPSVRRPAARPTTAARNHPQQDRSPRTGMRRLARRLSGPLHEPAPWSGCADEASRPGRQRQQGPTPPGQRRHGMAPPIAARR